MAEDKFNSSEKLTRRSKTLLAYTLCVSLFFLLLYSLTHEGEAYLNLLFYTYVSMSLVSFLLYGLDKWLAKKEAYRIPEKKLHLCNLLGGWPGALMAQQIFRHKTQKTSFRIVFWFSSGFNLLILILLFTALGEKLLNLIKSHLF